MIEIDLVKVPVVEDLTEEEIENMVNVISEGYGVEESDVIFGLTYSTTGVMNITIHPSASNLTQSELLEDLENALSQTLGNLS